MTKARLLILALAITSLVACGSKKVKPTEENITGENPAPVSDETIASQDMSLAPEGSDSGKIPGLYTIHFEYDRATLTDDARQKVEMDAQWMKEHPDAYVQIEGHCDRHGSQEYNLALGERRANTVKKYLTNLGVDGKKLSTISYGKEKLLEHAENEVADARNRRANMKVVTAPVVSPRL